MTKLWILDFDGTLVDSEKAIKKCYLEVGEQLIPERKEFIENMLIGPTLDESVRMILTKEKEDLIEIFKDKFQYIYDRKIIFETKEYPGVTDTLEKIKSNGDDIWVATNKRSYPTLTLINYYKWEKFFNKIYCMNEYPNIKNKTDLVKNKISKLNTKKNIFFVGDTIADGEAAQNNNINFIYAKYGYGRNCNWKKIKIYKSIEKFSEVLEI